MSDDQTQEVCEKDFRLNKRNRERLAILKRRHDHLAATANGSKPAQFVASCPGSGLSSFDFERL